MSTIPSLAAADHETLVLVYVVTLTLVSVLSFVVVVSKNIAYTAFTLAAGLAVPHYLFLSAIGESPMPAVLSRCTLGATAALMRGMARYDDLVKGLADNSDWSFVRPAK